MPAFLASINPALENIFSKKDLFFFGFAGKKPETKIKKTPWNLNLDAWNYESYTVVQFLPDDSVFETTEFKTKFFMNQLKEYAFLTAGIKFELIDHKTDQHYTYYFEGGIKTYLKSLNRNKNCSIHPFFM